MPDDKGQASPYVVYQTSSKVRQQGLPVHAMRAEGTVFVWVALSTSAQVIGLLKLPLDGSPDKWMGLIAHPTEVADIAVSR